MDLQSTIGHKYNNNHYFFKKYDHKHKNERNSDNSSEVLTVNSVCRIIYVLTLNLSYFLNVSRVVFYLMLYFVCRA